MSQRKETIRTTLNIPGGERQQEQARKGFRNPVRGCAAAAGGVHGKKVIRNGKGRADAAAPLKAIGRGVTTIR